ncbi:MAG: LacI family DNA-binding transcriptional regulator, partial [Spirochaetales bacterium]
RVRQAAKELGYITSRQAALFARRKTKTLAFIVPSYGSFPPFSRSYFPALLDGAVLEADELDYSITIILDKQRHKTEDYYTLVQSKTVDGLLFAVTRADFQPFQGLREQGVPFVLINNYHTGLNSVDAKPEPGMRKAFQHVYILEHRHFGYITGDMQYRNAVDRLDTFKKLSEEFDIKTTIVEGDFSKKSGYLGAEKLLSIKNPPSVIFTSSDRCAFGVLQYASSKGIRVPEELSVVGYDNLPPVQDITPPLSTVSQPVTELARHATRLLIDILEGKRQEPIQEWLETDFIARSSTAKYNKPRRLWLR